MENKIWLLSFFLPSFFECMTEDRRYTYLAGIFFHFRFAFQENIQPWNLKPFVNPRTKIALLFCRHTLCLGSVQLLRWKSEILFFSRAQQISAAVYVWVDDQNWLYIPPSTSKGFSFLLLSSMGTIHRISAIANFTANKVHCTQNSVVLVLVHKVKEGKEGERREKSQPYSMRIFLFPVSAMNALILMMMMVSLMMTVVMLIMRMPGPWWNQQTAPAVFLSPPLALLSLTISSCLIHFISFFLSFFPFFLLLNVPNGRKSRPRRPWLTYWTDREVTFLPFQPDVNWLAPSRRRWIIGRIILNKLNQKLEGEI